MQKSLVLGVRKLTGQPWAPKNTKEKHPRTDLADYVVSPRKVDENPENQPAERGQNMPNSRGNDHDSGAGVARAWRGRGAGYTRVRGKPPPWRFWVWVARAWRGHSVGVARACPVTPGMPGCIRPQASGATGQARPTPASRVLNTTCTDAGVAWTRGSTRGPRTGGRSLFP
eukprot:gene7595-biopygen1517